MKQWGLERKRMLEFLEEMRELKSDDRQAHEILDSIESVLVEKTYGLVFEQHREALWEQLKDRKSVV